MDPEEKTEFIEQHSEVTWVGTERTGGSDVVWTARLIENDRDLMAIEITWDAPNKEKITQRVVPNTIDDLIRYIEQLDAGEGFDGWEDGSGNGVGLLEARMIIEDEAWDAVAPEYPLYAVFKHDGRYYGIEIPADADEDADLWECIDLFDRVHGTNIYDILSEEEFVCIEDGRPTPGLHVTSYTRICDAEDVRAYLEE